jgi:hypothetical protein
MKLIVAAGLLASLVQPQTPALRIVVVEGEGAVNIIQQKTAVRPLIEVRDRNNVPVAGATVTFTIGSGGQSAAFAGGVQTLTVTTNTAGQAAASGLNALSSGAFQIQVQAAYQGQIATAAISQTNFATAAAASQAGAATGAAGGGGGISGTTIGIVGAAVAGGAVAATQLAGRDEDGGNASEGTTYTGTFSGQFLYNTTTSSTTGSTTCVSTRSINGTLKITLRAGNTDGRAEMSGSRQEVSISGGSTCSPQTGTLSLAVNEAVTGGPSNLTFVNESSGTSPTPNGGGSVTVTETTKFLGSLSGGVITGMLGFESLGRGMNNVNGTITTISNTGSASFPITLR